MMYGKLENNNLIYAPNYFVIDGNKIINPNDEIYLEQGYLPIEYTQIPEAENGYYAIYRWVEDNNKITQKWNVIKDTRPLSESEINTMLIKQQINTLVVDDNTALRMISYYPEWETNFSYAIGFKVQYEGKLWRVLQAHTSLEGWQPTVAPSLWEQINETYAGTLEEPIPYSGNMALENGKYYMQDYVIYKCFRNTINPVYNPLVDLVGLYVEMI